MQFNSTTPEGRLHTSNRMVSIPMQGDCTGSRLTATIGASTYRMNCHNIITTGATTATIVSADVNDTAAGAGARTVLIEGLDANGTRQTTTVTLNGTTPVNIPGTWKFISKVTLASAGTAVASNYGILTVALGGEQILNVPAGVGRSMTGAYMVPQGNTLRLTDIYIQSTSNTYNYNARLELNLWTSALGRRLMDFTPQLQPTNLKIEEIFPANTIVEFSAFKYGDSNISFVANARGYLLDAIETA